MSGKLLRRWLLNLTLHRRLTLFWSLALAGCVSPWLLDLKPQAPGSGAESCTIRDIHDGDTLTLRCKTWGQPLKVRLHCIDAPELQQSPWGQQSRDHLRRIAGERLHLRTLNTDRYGRTLGELYREADGQSLNLAQVRAGQAAVYSRYCNEERFQQAERQAKQEGNGIWARAGMQQRPWEWRQANRTHQGSE